ncbi:MAG TPA: response regulator [Bryobacteraceae bacterium]|jgi:CheY-like chemotaxis protein|nr:response regulator [Bryobacteraceae bacterium]
MPARKDSLSVLVVDEEPEILAFFARILDSNGMRALLARTPEEAIGIAQRGYVPIDLVVTDVLLKTDGARPGEESNGSELVNRLREFRPDVRALYMSANSDDEVIRVELMDRNFEAASNDDDPGLIASIRSAATAPLVHRVGGMHRS